MCFIIWAKLTYVWRIVVHFRSLKSKLIISSNEFLVWIPLNSYEWKNITCHDCNSFKWKNIYIYPLLIVFLCNPMPFLAHWIVTTPKLYPIINIVLKIITKYENKMWVLLKRFQLTWAKDKFLISLPFISPIKLAWKPHKVCHPIDIHPTLVINYPCKWYHR